MSCTIDLVNGNACEPHEQINGGDGAVKYNKPSVWIQENSFSAIQVWNDLRIVFYLRSTSIHNTHTVYQQVTRSIVYF